MTLAHRAAVSCRRHAERKFQQHGGAELLANLRIALRIEYYAAGLSA